MPTIVGPGDYVKVTYKGRTKPVRGRDGSDQGTKYDDQTPLRLMWDSRPFECPVGQSTFVPFEAMSVAFGDPRSGESVASYRTERGSVGFIGDRATEVRRLRTLYDNQLGDEGEILFAPEAEIETLDGEPIQTVLDDPTGVGVIPVTTTVLDRDALLAQVQRQQRMIEQLAAAQGIDLENIGTPLTAPVADTGGTDGGDGTSTPSNPSDDPFQTAQVPEDGGK